MISTTRLQPRLEDHYNQTRTNTFHSYFFRISKTQRKATSATRIFKSSIASFSSSRLERTMSIIISSCRGKVAVHSSFLSSAPPFYPLPIQLHPQQVHFSQCCIQPNSPHIPTRIVRNCNHDVQTKTTTLKRLHFRQTRLKWSAQMFQNPYTSELKQLTPCFKHL